MAAKMQPAEPGPGAPTAPDLLAEALSGDDPIVRDNLDALACILRREGAVRRLLAILEAEEQWLVDTDRGAA